MNNFKNIYYVVIPLLIIGISYRFTTFLVALLAFLPLFFTTSRHTIGVFLLMYGGPLGGVIRTVYAFIPIYGILLEFIGFILIWDKVKDCFINHKNALWGMLLTLLFFGFFYLIGPIDDFSTKKYLTMCSHGIMMLFGYFVFDQSKKIDAECLASLLTVASICMFAYVIQAVSMSPGNLFDYNWFREQYLAETRRNLWNSIAIVDYQHIGMLVLFALVVILSQVKLSRWKAFIWIICLSELALVSGCRQAIVGVLIAIVLRMVLFRNENAINNKRTSVFLWGIVALFLLYFAGDFIFSHVGSDKMSSTLEEGDLGRQIRWLQALSIFFDHPIFGAGIGGYHAISDMVYPHNFILELLAETGLIGLLMTIVILVVPLLQKNDGLFRVTKSSLFFYFIVLGIFVRVMVSSDLTESIELFSAVFAVTAGKNLSKHAMY